MPIYENQQDVLAEKVTSKMTKNMNGKEQFPADASLPDPLYRPDNEESDHEVSDDHSHQCRSSTDHE